MKRISMKIALAAAFIAVGTLGLQAQIGRGGTCLGNGTGSGNCLTSTTLTAEQIAILEDLRTTYRSAMADLRALLVAAPTFADKRVIRQEMVALREAHLAEVKALLDSWGLPASAGGTTNLSTSGNATFKGKGYCK